MVRFCPKCGSYVALGQESCSQCASVETKGLFRSLKPSELTGEAVLGAFPSETLRPHQKAIISKTVDAFTSGKKCVIVVAPTGFGKCLLPDERVFSRNGLIEMKELVASDDSNFRTDAFSIGRSPVIRITTKHGYSLRGGRKHRILVFDGEFKWKSLDELKIGDCVPIVYQKVEGVVTPLEPLPHRYAQRGAIPAQVSLSSSLEEPLAELLGFYLADGCIGSNIVIISSTKNDVRQDISKIVDRYKISASFYPTSVVLNSVHLARLFERLVGKGAYAKRVPKQIFRAEEGVRIAFLRGYFRGDGHYNVALNVSEFYTVSLDIAQTVQLLLLSLGIFSTLARKKGRYNGRRHLSWRVTISGSQNVRLARQLFGIRIRTASSSSWEKIPMVSGKINSILKEYVRRKEISYRSSAYRALRTMESYALGEREPTRQTLLANLSRMKLVADMPEYQELVNVALTDALFDYVKRIEDAGEREVYEISCKNGTYVAQGFISHNSYVNAAFTSVTRSFYVTPQLALIDQLLADPYLKGRFVEIKGRQNYRCYYSPRRGVHVGKCETEDFPCHERFDVCPYWMQKQLALNAPSVLMSLAYLIFEGTTEGSETYLGTRSLLLLDEAHNLEEQCLNHIALKFTPFSVPYEIYHKYKPFLKDVEARPDLDVFLANLADYLKTIVGRLEYKAKERGLSIAETDNLKLMERFLESYNLFRFSNSEWVWQVRNDELLLQPVFAREFMKDLIWKRGECYIISSATVLDPEEYIRLNGLSDILKGDEIAILEVPSTFPVENRPVIDATVGLLSRQQWDENMPLAVSAVENILRKEKGSVAIHCHSYRHQRALVAKLSSDLKHRLIVHTGKDREEKLQEWMRSRGKVFVSVAFNEGQDWKYSLCDAQILLKVPFADIGDKRVKKRIELGYRQWYQNQAMLEAIQAYGRAIRAEDDRARFYVVDGSFISLVRSTWQFIPDWFKEALPETLKPS